MRIGSLLVKPVSALCNLQCEYCFYLDRQSDPYREVRQRRMSTETLERLVDGFLFYSYPRSAFCFQGGEPTLAGLPFFEKLVEFQQKHGREGHEVSNSIQTNGLLLDENWCALFEQYNWLVGLSLDGPQDAHDRYRGQSWTRVMRALELLGQHRVPFNILCVVSQANVERARELYRFFRALGVGHLQFIPLAEFDRAGRPLPFTISPAQYGRFLCELFEEWWPDRRTRSIRIFDNILEALAGGERSDCSRERTCDSYSVVEYNGDVYPCDFFVEPEWKLGNIEVDSWAALAGKQARARFAARKTLPRPECDVCEYEPLCHCGCPKLRRGPNGRFEDLDYFCEAYKAIFSRSKAPLERELARVMKRR